MKTQKKRSKSFAAQRALSICASVALAFNLCLPFPAALAETVSTDSSIDITEQWQLEPLVITTPGTYVLSADIETTFALSVSLPEGETATFDFAGHTATVSGGATTAIDLSGNQGSVAFVNSAYVAPEADEAFAPNAGIVLSAQDPAAPVVAINASASQQSGESLPTASFAGLSISATVQADAVTSYGDDVVLVSAGTASSDKAADATCSLSFSDCAFNGTLQEDVDTAALEAVGLTTADQGSVVGIDVAAPSVSLNGSLSFNISGGLGSVALRTACERGIVFDADVSFETSVPFALSQELATQLPATLFVAAQGSTISAAAQAALSAPTALQLVANKSNTELVAQQSNAAAAYAEQAAGFVAYSSEILSSLIEGEQQSATAQSGDSYLAAQTGTCLNDMWKDRSTDCNIIEGGTYYLSGDLTATNHLVINAPGQDVTIKFNGFTLQTKGSDKANERALVKVLSAKSVSFDGSGGQDLSTLTSGGEIDQYGINIATAAVGCAVSINNLRIDLHPTQTTLRNVGAHCVRACAGSLTVTNCDFSMDFGEQEVRTSNTASAAEAPSAIYASSVVTSVKLTDTTASAVGTPMFAPSSITDLSGIGNAYGVYSQAASTVVSGGSYSATSAIGSASAILAKNLEVTGTEVQLAADAKIIAAGITTTSAAGATINAPLSFEQKSTYSTATTVAPTLRSIKANGFTFGASGTPSGRTYTVLVGDGELAAANDALTVIGTFKSLQQSQKDAWTAALTNVFADGSCTVQQDSSTAYFALDNTKATARIGSTYYATLPAALEAFATGDTLYILKDVGAISLPANMSGVIDLGNHTASSIAYGTSSSAGDGAGELVIQNGLVSSVQSVSSFVASIYYASANALTLKAITVNAAKADAILYGVYATAAAGQLTLESCSISVTSSRTSQSAGCYAVYLDGGTKSSLIASGSSFAARSTSLNTTTYGVYGNVPITLEGCSINAQTVSGATSVTGGARTSKACTLKNTTIDITTAGAVSNAFGLWGSGGAGVEYAVDSCNISVKTSDGTSQSSYWCLQSGTNAASAYKGSWTLSGQSSYASSGCHIGANMTTISLGSDFSLTQDSASELLVSQCSIEGEVGFKAAEEGADISLLAGLFASADCSVYADHKLISSGADKLIWVAKDASSAGAVVVEHNGSVSSVHNSVSAAFAAAEAGDTVRLTCDITESGAISVATENLTFDLCGHTFTLNAGSAAKNATGAFTCTAASGQMTIANSAAETAQGVFVINVGASTESATAAIYKGIVVSSGSGVSTEQGTSVEVNYVGSTAAMLQRDITLQGFAVTNGSLSLGGNVDVLSAPADGAYGAMNAYAVYAEAATGATVDVTQGPASSVTINNQTSVKTTDDTAYPEGTAIASTTASYAVRELKVDPETDKELYDAIQKQFKLSATYDDPNDYDSTSQFGTGIYYTSGYMTLGNFGTEYDGMKFWAFSDVVATEDVGKMDSIVASHIFVQTPIEVLPNAYGIASSASSAGAVNISVAGSTTANNAHGPAYALDAQGGASTTWKCSSSALNATADTTLHTTGTGNVDLRNYIDFGKEYSSTVMYKGGHGVIPTDMSFTAPQARAIRASSLADVTLAGLTSYSVQATDAAFIEGSGFKVASTFASPSGACTVANVAGANISQTVFAMKAASAQGALNPALFADVYNTLDAAANTDGNLVWGASGEDCIVKFNVSTTTVKTYRNAQAIDLSELTALAQRLPDARNSFELVGWSLNPDDNAQSGYVACDTQLEPTESATYYAVYDLHMAEIPVSFTNVRDSSGALLNVDSITAHYNETLGEALENNGTSICQPSDYRDDQAGITYRFVGWLVYTSSQSCNATIYNPDGVCSGLVFDSTLYGVTSNRAVSLQAVYAPVRDGEHLVCFDVDFNRSWTVVADGAQPLFTDANPDDTSYGSPDPATTETGVSYTLKSWTNAQTGEESYYVVPAAYEDAVYEASFNTTASDLSITFYQLKQGATGSYTRSETELTSTYDDSAWDMACSLIAPGRVFEANGKLYEFLGWAVREDDKEPLFTNDNPIPNPSDDSIYSSSTYYGIYKELPYMATVEFVDGGEVLGSTTVSANDTIEATFAATGATQPADRSDTELFLGWNVEPDSSSTTNSRIRDIESWLENPADTVTLYSVYGSQRSYTVNMYKADCKTLVATLTVEGGSTVADTLKAKELTISNPAEEGKYFAGWATADGKEFTLDTPVKGALSLHAIYEDIEVQSPDKTDIDATVSCTQSGLEDAQSVTFKITNTSTSDLPIRTFTAEKGFNTLKCYHMELVAVGADGEEAIIDGATVGATIKVYVGTQYKKNSVRAFWLKSDDTVNYSESKTVDDEGYITFTFADYGLGDIDEGGNLAICYAIAGADPVSPGGSAPSISTSTNGLKAASLNTSALSALKTSAAASPAAALSATANGASSGQSNSAVNIGNSNSADEDEDAQADGNAWDSEGWDANTVIFVILFFGLIAAAVIGIRRMFLIGAEKRDDDEEEADLNEPMITSGINF